ncbi:MAG: lipopolysaccharide transport periplasmic protein LptA [Burkholderiaceae bacterium]
MALALVLGPAGPSMAQATKTADQPIQIEADRMEYDDRQQVNVFSGNVVLTRGTLEIHAARLVLRQDAAGNSQAEASGSPASFKQLRDDNGELIEGSGQELRYDDGKQELLLINQASLRKSVGGQVSDEVHGGRIIYRRDSDHLTVQGAPSADSEKPGRVRVIIQPRSSNRPSSPALPLKPAKSSGRS